MSRLKQLIQEVHRRSLWQVLAIYVGGALAAALLAGCRGDQTLGPTTGSVEVRAATTGADLDPGGYTVAVAGRQASVATNGSVTFADLPIGSHQVTLGEITENCNADGGTVRSADVIAGELSVVEFDVMCTRLPPLLMFHSSRDGAFDIYLINEDGTGLANLTNDPAHTDWVADWSPGGSRIAFASDREGNSEIFLMNRDGSGAVNLTNHGAWDSHPVWSPDGSRIAFLSDRNGIDSQGQTINGKTFDVFVVNADGSDLIDLSTNPDGLDDGPRWSPDGSMLVFASDSALFCCGSDLLRVNADGSGLTPLTRTPQVWEFPWQWSLDGSQILFTRTRDVYVVDSDGSNLINLTNDLGQDVEPHWSPDASRIAFRSSRDGDADIYVMDAGGGGLLAITNNGDTDTMPRWSPDGNLIAFVTDAFDGTGDIAVVRADGSVLRRLTSGSGTDSWPRWRPR